MHGGMHGGGGTIVVEKSTNPLGNIMGCGKHYKI